MREESVASLFRGSTLLAIRSATFSILRFSLEFVLPQYDPEKGFESEGCVVVPLYMYITIPSICRAESVSGTFFNMLVLTNVPDLVKLPLDALRLRVIIGLMSGRECLQKKTGM